MKNLIISIIIFLIWAILGMWWYYSCPMCSTNSVNNGNEITNELKTPPIKEEVVSHTIDGFNIANSIGADVFNFSDPMQIFNHKDSTGLVYVSEKTMHFKDSIFTYLNNNQDKELLITGSYKDMEWRNNDETQNFGVDRATYLKKMLTKFGVNSDKINVIGIKEGFSYSNGKYASGIHMSFKDIDAAHSAIIEAGITNKTLYTHFNSREFKPDNTLQAYAGELKNYLAKHPNKNVSITGHSDDVGDEKVNEILARDRATNVMNYFTQRGIDKVKLNAFSKGETTPVSTNTTKEGRALNRRIEIKVN